jgi:Flp pilus assembly pilin Flp
MSAIAQIMMATSPFRKTQAPRTRGQLGYDTRGNASIEYALLGAIVGLGIISGLTGMKRSLNVNFDKISYQIAQATANNDVAKTVTKTVAASSYTDGGRPVDQKWVYYSDGSYDLVRTSGGTSNWFQQSVDHYDQNGVNTGALWVDSAGNVTNAAYTWLNATTLISQQSGAGSCNCTYRSAWSFDPQPDGSNNVVYKNDLIDGSHAASWMYQSQTVVYNSKPNEWNYIGDVQTYPNGTTGTYGQSIAKYL